VVLHIEVVTESDAWSALPDREALAKAAIEAAAAAADPDGSADAEVCVLLCDDERVRELNQLWRSIDKPTNVLSFPSYQPAVAGAPAMLGDIAIAYETVQREADEEGKSLAAHTTHMVAHGFLHLLGYDHEKMSDAETMEDLERAILRQLGHQDPYRNAEPDDPLSP
jgi:probable rRNA maturation factor